MASRLTTTITLQLAAQAGLRVRASRLETVAGDKGLDSGIPHSYQGSVSNKPFSWSCTL